MLEKAGIKGFLSKDEKRNQVEITQFPGPDSAPIETLYEPAGFHKGYTLLKVTLITGRTHQIRAHLAFVGHPIAGDSKYGGKEAAEEVKRLFHINSQLLHSFQQVFPNLPEPLSYLSGRSFTAPLPGSFSKICKDWEKLTQTNSNRGFD